MTLDDALDNNLFLDSSATERERSRSLLRCKEAMPLIKKLLLDHLPPTKDPLRNDFLAGCTALGQRAVKPSVTFSRPVEDVVGIPIRSNVKLKNRLPGQPPPPPCQKRMSDKLKGQKRARLPNRIMSKFPMQRKLDQKKVDVQKSDGSTTTSKAKQRPSWRNYPKPWLTNIKQPTDDKPGYPSSIKPKLSGIRSLPPLLPTFGMDLTKPAPKEVSLGRRTSTQMLIQDYEEGRCYDELSFEDAVGTVGNVRTTRSQVRAKSKVGSSPLPFDELLEQLDQDPYTNALRFHQQTASTLLVPEVEPLPPLIVEPELEFDSNRNFRQFKSGPNSPSWSDLPNSSANNNDVVRARVQTGGSDRTNVVNPQGSNGASDLDRHQEIARMRKPVPEVSRRSQPVQVPVQNPTLSGIPMPYITWEPRLHQSPTTRSMLTEALPLYQLNYFPEIHDNFPPLLLPHLPPPRVPTARRPPPPQQSSTNTQWISASSKHNLAYPLPPIYSTTQLDPRLVAPGPSTRFLSPPAGFLPSYLSSTQLSYSLPAAPPPSQQHLPQQLVFSQHSIPFSDFQRNVPAPAYALQQPGYVDSNGNFYASSREHVPWETPYWYQPQLMNVSVKHKLLNQRKSPVQSDARKEPENVQGHAETPRGPPRGRSRNKKRNPRNPSRVPSDVPAKSKVDSGEVAPKTVPLTASMSMPNCASEMMGIRDELKILVKLRQSLRTPRSRSADSSCASIRVLLSSRKVQGSKLPRKKIPSKILANLKHYGHKFCPCYDCRQAHGLHADASQSMTSIEQIDYVRKNIEDLKKYKNFRQESIVVVDTPKGDKVPPLITFVGRKGYGKIPGYLIKRKDEIKKERQKRLGEANLNKSIESEVEKQEVSRRNFRRMERKRAAAKANFCLLKTNLDIERPKWNPLESNHDANYNCFMYVNGRMQSEFFGKHVKKLLRDDSRSEQHPNLPKLEVTPVNLKPQKKLQADPSPALQQANIGKDQEVPDEAAVSTVTATTGHDVSQISAEDPMP